MLNGAGLAPFGAVGGSPGLGLRQPSFLRETLAVGLLFGLAAAMASEALIVMSLVLVGLILGSIFAGTPQGMARMVAVAVAGMAVAAVLNLPWLADSLAVAARGPARRQRQELLGGDPAVRHRTIRQ